MFLLGPHFWAPPQPHHQTGRPGDCILALGMWAEKKAPLPELSPTGSPPSLAAQLGADDTVRGVTVLEHSRDPGWVRKALGPKTQEELTPANKHGVRLEVDGAPVEPSGRTQPVSTLPAAWETLRQDPVMPCPDP